MTARLLATRSALALVLACPLALACAPAPAPVAGAAAWFGDVTPPADDTFTFNLGAEPESFDPGLASGQPDGRVVRLVFEGLTREDPRTLEPTPGQAYRWEISPDGLVYTFHLRPGLVWSDGRKLVAEDFRWSWLRVLDPATASRYAGLLAPIRNAEEFNSGRLADRDAVGIAAPDDSTLVVTLRAPTPYFLYLLQFYTCMPVPRWTIEEHGNRWTRPEHLVHNGAFRIFHWRQNDHFEFVPNPRYWDAASVRLDRIRAYTVNDLNTSTNLYKAGVFDWNPSGYIPSQFIPHLRGFADYRHGPYQGIYFYSINVTRKPFDDPWVRRALNHAVDRVAITRDLLKGSRDPWGGMTPAGYHGYAPPPPIAYDPGRARECLERAGYPGGRGFPKISILFNTSEDHRRIAEAIQAMWRRELSIEVELENQEWASYLQACTNLDYGVARRSWIGDYLDPNTFLACWVTGDGNNRTGWSNARYDQLILDAAHERDAGKRLAMLAEAEALLLDEAPVIPIYHYSTNELVKPYVRGIHQTPLDIHPLTHVWIDREWRRHEGAAGPAAASDAGAGPDVPAADAPDAGGAR